LISLECWHPVDGLSKYALMGSLTVAPGATLTIPSGVEIKNDSSSYELRVKGRLDATGVDFTGNYPRLIADGQMNLSGCTFTTPLSSGQAYASYSGGSSGTVDHVWEPLGIWMSAAVSNAWERSSVEESQSLRSGFGLRGHHGRIDREPSSQCDWQLRSTTSA